MNRLEAQTEEPIKYIEISSALEQHPSIRDVLKGFLDKWRGSEVFQQTGEIAFSEKPLIIGALKASGKMAEDSKLMKEAMEAMEVICENVARPASRLEFLLKIRPKEEALSAVTRECLLEEIAKGLGLAQKPEIQKFFNEKVKKVVPRVNRFPNLIHGLILQRTPDGRAAIFYCREDGAGGNITPFKMWPPAILPEDSEIGLALYFLTSSWGLIKQEETPLMTAS